MAQVFHAAPIDGRRRLGRLGALSLPTGAGGGYSSACARGCAYQHNAPGRQYADAGHAARPRPPFRVRVAVGIGIREILLSLPQRSSTSISITFATPSCWGSHIVRLSRRDRVTGARLAVLRLLLIASFAIVAARW